MAKKLLGNGSYFEKKFKKKMESIFNSKKSHRFTKSTHISYIEKEVENPVIDQRSNTMYRPTSSYTKRITQPIEAPKTESRNTNYK